MKTMLHLSLFIGAFLLTAASVRAQVSTLSVVEENGPRSKRLNLVFLSEGYTSTEMATYAADVENVLDFLFTREPWSRYRSYFNIYRIQIASAESGTTYVTPSTQYPNPKTVNTYFGTAFRMPGVPQNNTLSEAGSSRANSLLNKHVPECDIPVVLVNDPRYGGSGGPIAVVTTDYYSAMVMEHEVGHSFAKLTDEYDESYNYPAIEYPNATTKTKLADIRWKHWIEPGTELPTPEQDPYSEEDYPYEFTVGLFEGANYRAKGWYRPHENALMRTIGRHPGSVTREAFILNYYSRISPVQSFSPTGLTQTFSTKQTAVFSVTPMVPSTPPALSVEWQLDGVTLAGETGVTLTRTTESLGNGTRELKAIVRDTTSWVRNDPKKLVEEEVVWTLKLSNQVDPPVITTQLPESRVQSIGSNFSLDATATGPGPITYEWLLNNKPLKPAVTTPTLFLGHINVANGGTYTVKVRNSAHVITRSCALHVVDPNVSRVVVGKGKNATLAFKTSPKPPAATWSFNEGLLSNGGRYSGATTTALVIKGVTEADTGEYFFTCGEYAATVPVNLQVVTDEPDYTGVTILIEPGHVGGIFNRNFPLPGNVLRLPNSFSASKLPAGLTLDPKTGRISGNPTVASSNQTEGDLVNFTVGNEFGKVVLPVRILIKPLPASIDGVFSGYVQQNSTLGGPTGGRIDMTVLKTGGYSGKLIIGTETLPFSGQLSVLTPSAVIAYGLVKASPKHLLGQEAMLLFTITDGGDEDPLTAVLDSPTQFNGWRNKWLPPESDDVFKGYHTFGLTVPAGSDVSVPKGNGFGSVTIDANGKTVVVGKLADGESFTSTSHLSPEGGVLVYQALYTTPTKGSLVAVLDLDPGTEGGPAVFTNKTFTQWKRPQDTRGTARVYAGGFGPLDLDAFGGLYTAPVKPEILMGLEPAGGSPLVNAYLSFAMTVGDDLLPVDAGVGLEIKTVAVAKVTTANPKSVTFTATPADGRFKGSYMTKDDDPRPPLAPNKPRPQISRKADYQGIIVNENGQLTGCGFFLRDALPKADGSNTPTTSPRYSGDVRLERVGL